MALLSITKLDQRSIDLGDHTQYQTAFAIVYADNDYQAKQLAELQYGVGSVLNYTLME